MNQPSTTDFEHHLQCGLADCGISVYDGECRNSDPSGILVAVSGGADSVALLRGLNNLNRSHQRPQPQLRLVVGHLNHGLRGSESDDDEQWLRELCQELQIPVVCETQNIKKLAGASQSTCEELARKVRYEFLLLAAEKNGCSFIATAHSADDQAETILHHVLRGTAISGLAGIPRQRLLTPSIRLIRPLLTVRRAAIESYLQRLEQSFRTDRTNQNVRFTRNRLRQDVLPLIRETVNPQVDQALLRLGEQASELQKTLDQLATSVLTSTILEQAPAICRLDCQRLSQQPNYLLRHCFVMLWKRQNWPRQRMGAEDWLALADLVHATSGGRSLPGMVQATRRNQLLVLERQIHTGSDPLPHA